MQELIEMGVYDVLAEIAEEMKWALWVDSDGRYDDGEWGDEFAITIDNIEGRDIRRIWAQNLGHTDGTLVSGEMDELCAELGVDNYRDLNWDTIPREWIVANTEFE